MHFISFTVNCPLLLRLFLEMMFLILLFYEASSL